MKSILISVAVVLMVTACFNTSKRKALAEAWSVEAGKEYPIPRAFGTNNGIPWVEELQAIQIKGAPRWTGESVPPLSPNQAKEVARRYLDSQTIIPAHPFVPIEFQHTTSGWLMIQISIRNYYLSKDLWYYELRWLPLEGTAFTAEMVVMFVTMDGKVAPLRKVD
jgi:hypothetical protein